MKRPLLAGALFCLAYPLALLAQTATAPNIRTGTRIVVVDVTVTDAHGNPVQNLKQPDFRVLENGNPQVVTHFEEHSRPSASELAKAPAEPKLEPNVYTNFAQTPEGEPVTLLVFDILNTPVEKQANARRQLLAFLNTMKPGTSLALLSLTTRLTLLARSQVAVYPIDARGLTSTPLSDVSASNYALNGGAGVGDDNDLFSTRTAHEHSTMRRMAKATGGKAYVNVNDLSQAIGDVLNDGSNYYTLVYSPTDKREDGSYRKISVGLASGNDTLIYRDGYYSDTTASGAVASPDALRTAMQRGAPAPSEIIFKALVVASPSTSDKLAEGNTASPKTKPPYRLLTIAYAANPGDINMPERTDGTRQVALDFVALVYDRAGQLFTQQSNQVNVFAKPAAIEQFLKEGVRYQQQIAVPAKGEYYLRVGIHDLIADKIGALEIPVASIATTPGK